MLICFVLIDSLQYNIFSSSLVTLPYHVVFIWITWLNLFLWSYIVFCLLNHLVGNLMYYYLSLPWKCENISVIEGIITDIMPHLLAFKPYCLCEGIMMFTKEELPDFIIFNALCKNHLFLSNIFSVLVFNYSLSIHYLFRWFEILLFLMTSHLQKVHYFLQITTICK